MSRCRHAPLGRLAQFAMLTGEQVEAQNRRAYGDFIPGSAARMNRAEAWERGERTCERCGRTLDRRHHTFCSLVCRFPSTGEEAETARSRIVP